MIGFFLAFSRACEWFSRDLEVLVVGSLYPFVVILARGSSRAHNRVGFFLFFLELVIVCFLAFSRASEWVSLN